MCIPPRYRLLRLPEVLRITGLARSTLFAMVARGEFPPPVHIGPRAVAWREDEVWAWVESRPRAVRPRGGDGAAKGA